MLSIKRQINRESQPRATILDNKGHLRLKREGGWLTLELGRHSLRLSTQAEVGDQ